jgi:hypothetical protein
MHFLKKTYGACPTHDIEIVLDDVNAQIGK